MVSLALRAVVLSTALAAPQRLPLLREGRSIGPIVVPEGASADVRDAADELARYLSRITVTPWGVTTEDAHGGGPGIFVGRTQKAEAEGVRAEGVKPEGFRMRTTGRSVLIVGADDAGTCHGVYDLLEGHCGVRWFAPGELGEVVPRKPDLSIPQLDYSEAPSFASRSIWLAWGWKVEKTKFRRYADWCRHNRLGGRRVKMGHNLNAPFPSALFPGHPKLFPLIDGQRFCPGIAADWQPCTSNPEVIERVVADARRYFDAYPHEWMYSVSPTDGFGWCECEGCRALDPAQHRSDKRYHKAHRFVQFANTVADELARSHPDRVIGFYAYLGVIDPPVGMELRDNVVVGVCRYGRAGDNWHPIDAPAEQSAQCAFYRRIIDGWAKVAKRLVAREYFTMLIAPNDAIKRVAQAAHLDRDIRYYRDHGCIAINSQAAPEWGSAGLNFYLAAKLMWNAGANVAELLNDYYAKLYGPAGPAMRSYFETCQELAIRGRAQKRDLFGSDRIKALAQRLDDALARTEGSVYAKRVSLTTDLFRLWRTGRELPSVNAPGSAEAAQRYLDLAESLKGSDALAYEHFRYCILRPPELPKPEPYHGPDLVPLYPRESPKASEGPGAWIRGASTWLVVARAGEDVAFRIQHRRLGRLYLSPLAYQVVSPGGNVATKGTVSLGRSDEVAFKSAEAGIYRIDLAAGINSYAVDFGARHAVLKGPKVHFHQRAQRYYFLVPKGTSRFDISARGEWAEAARLRIFDPTGAVRYDDETDKNGSCFAQVPCAPHETGKPWSLLLSKPANRVFDDAYLSILTGVPPYLSTSPQSLLVPSSGAVE